MLKVRQRWMVLVKEAFIEPWLLINLLFLCRAAVTTGLDEPLPPSVSSPVPDIPHIPVCGLPNSESADPTLSFLCVQNKLTYARYVLITISLKFVNGILNYVLLLQPYSHLSERFPFEYLPTLCFLYTAHVTCRPLKETKVTLKLQECFSSVLFPFRTWLLFTGL